MKLEFCRHIFEKYSNINFHENRSSESRVATCGHRETDKIAELTKPVVAFRHIVNAPKNKCRKRKAPPED